MNRYVSLDEKVTAQFYAEEHEEWTMQTVTIADVLDSVCDDYTILPSTDPNILDDGTLTITVQHGMLSKVNRVIVDEVGTKFCKMMYQDAVPSAERKGRWIRNFDGNEWYWYCSACKGQWYEEDLWMGGNDFPNFCPNCGADMRPDNVPLADDDSIYG